MTTLAGVPNDSALIVDGRLASAASWITVMSTCRRAGYTIVFCIQEIAVAVAGG